jgi:hypothetical protein
MTNSHISQTIEESAPSSTPQEVIDKVAQTLSGTIEGLGTEIGDQLRSVVREANKRHLTIREANGRLILRIPLTVGVAGGIGFLMFVPIRRAILLSLAALFARIYFSVEDNDVSMAMLTPEERGQV